MSWEIYNMRSFSMLEVLEVIFSIFILTALITLLYTTGKIITKRVKAVDELMKKTGERFEIFLREGCYLNDNYTVINVGGRSYLCGRGEIKEKSGTN